jgi:hypothetical protein
MADGGNAVGHYACGMAYPVPASWLAEVLEPLGTTFGERLIFSHDGPVARWSYDGHAAIVELGRTDRITARFVARPAIDAVSGRPAAPVYACEADGYPLTRAGCERMVTDMVAFFSGIREPRFTFVATR